MVDFSVIKELIYRRDRYSSKRAETMLVNYLDSYFAKPFPAIDLARTFYWLAKLEFSKANYTKALQYMLNSAEVLDIDASHIEELIRTKIYVAQLHCRVRQFKEAQDALIEANALAGGMCNKTFREEVRIKSNELFSLMARERSRD
jgi:nanoRNase/pAp phosphatase (c-di-AMP/oligoRNAs hydrolase)